MSGDVTRIATLLGSLLFVLVAGCAATDLAGLPYDPDGGGEDAAHKGDQARDEREICGNGIDDDGDGKVDETCPCTLGATQACWPGEAKHRNVGACKDGKLTCYTVDGEFNVWSDCEGAVLPSPDTSDDGIDQDCDGEGTTPVCVPAAENCTNGKDDDCDGKIDCADSNCATHAACVPACVPVAESCTNGKDDDCDGKIDCADPDCATNAACAPACVPVAENCTNGKDDDCDGKVDCDDSNCAQNAACMICKPFPSWEICGDGKDNECDGKTDCEDDECWSHKSCTCTERCTPGAWRWCDEEKYCAWGKQTCGPDGRWGTCVETTARPNGCSGKRFYDEDCCVDAGGCCQAMHLLTPQVYSVGTCQPVVVTCHAN
jgi:hypothetical protein